LRKEIKKRHHKSCQLTTEMSVVVVAVVVVAVAVVVVGVVVVGVVGVSKAKLGFSRVKLIHITLLNSVITLLPNIFDHI